MSSADFFTPRRSQRGILLALSMRAYVHFFPVWNHISVPIDKINELYIFPKLLLTTHYRPGLLVDKHDDAINLTTSPLILRGDQSSNL